MKHYRLICNSQNVLAILGTLIYGFIFILYFLFFYDAEFSFLMFTVIVGFAISYSISWKLSFYNLNIEFIDDKILIYTDQNFFVNINLTEFNRNEIKDFFTDKSLLFEYFSIQTSFRERIVIYHSPKYNEIDNFQELINEFKSIHDNTNPKHLSKEDREEEALIESKGGTIYLVLGLFSIFASIILLLEATTNSLDENLKYLLGIAGGLALCIKYYSSRIQSKTLKIREKTNKREQKKLNKKQEKKTKS